jgi:type II secretory pathway component GspD/PulD (secretin)
MLNRKNGVLCSIVLSFLFFSFGYGQESSGEVSKIVELSFITPQQLIESLSLIKDQSGCYQYTSGKAPLQIRFNQSTNQVLVSGPDNGVKELERIIGLFDTAPRQIVIEAKIVEIDNEKSSETGFDWKYLLGKIEVSHLSATWEWQKTNNTNPNANNYTNERKYVNSADETTLNLGDFLRLVQESGAGKITNVPRIVTINNQKGTIFDGSKLRYVAQMSSYSNIYQTDEVTAGLMLSVVPSLGKSGYLSLAVSAKYTYLNFPQINPNYNQYYNTPVETGQSIDNTVVVKDSESLLLGGFSRTEIKKRKSKFPILGSILPFLFSRDVSYEVKKDVLIILTPKVIDLNAPPIPDVEGGK